MRMLKDICHLFAVVGGRLGESVAAVTKVECLVVIRLHDQSR